MVVRPTPLLRPLPEDAPLPTAVPELVDSYRRLADVFHEVLAEQSLDALLVRIADALHDLIPHDTLTIYDIQQPDTLLAPCHPRNYSPASGDTVLGIKGIVTGFDAKPGAFAFYIQDSRGGPHRSGGLCYLGTWGAEG